MHSENKSDEFSLEFRDVQGRIVFERKGVHADDQIDISILERGIYFYRLTGSKGSKQGQMIKE